MLTLTQILKVEQDGKDGIIVKFSDGTFAGYVVEELLDLRPKRFPTTPVETDTPEPTSPDGRLP